jgi:hypothetical protein
MLTALSTGVKFAGHNHKFAMVMALLLKNMVNSFMVSSEITKFMKMA